MTNAVGSFSFFNTPPNEHSVVIIMTHIFGTDGMCAGNCKEYVLCSRRSTGMLFFGIGLVLTTDLGGGQGKFGGNGCRELLLCLTLHSSSVPFSPSVQAKTSARNEKAEIVDRSH